MEEPKKRGVGRPKTNRPNRLKVTITVLPDVYEKAMTKAYDNNSTFSRVVENALIDYIADEQSNN